MDERRTLRVSEAVKEELAELVGFELDDPRLATVGVTEANVSPDARHAHVKVAAGGGEREQRQVLAALEHAKNHLRRELASQSKMTANRSAPSIYPCSTVLDSLWTTG